MAVLLWDASALVKRYSEEEGAELTDALFAWTPHLSFVTTVGVYAEVYATLVRKRNAGLISQRAFSTAVTLAQAEVIQNDRFDLLEVDSPTIMASLTYIERHSINASDAALLSTFLAYLRASPGPTAPLYLVAVDARLLRAASREGMATLNPAAVSLGEISALLA